MVVPSDLFKGRPLTPFQALPDHQGGARDPKWIHRVVEVRGPETGLDTFHDGVFRSHHVVNLAGVMPVMTAVGRSKMTGREGPVLSHQLGLLRKIEKMGRGANRDEGLATEMLVKPLILRLLEIQKPEGENQEVGLWQVLGEIRKAVRIHSAVQLEMGNLELVILFQFV